MKTRLLGTTGISVSSLCLGTWMFGQLGNTTPRECIRMVHSGIDAGINFLDTADVYSSGGAQSLIGSALKGRRTDVVIATKVGYPLRDRQQSGGLTEAWIAESLNASLRRMRTDYVDVYMLHRPDMDVDLRETLAALDRLVSSGKVRAAGCSTFPAWMIVEGQCVSAREGFAPLRCEQPPYSIFVRAAERDTFPVAARYGMGVMTWSPLAGGWLTGKYRRHETPPAGSRGARATAFGAENPRLVERYDLSNSANISKFDALEQLTELARESGLSLPALALGFTQSHPAVTSTIIGPRTEDQLQALIRVADVELSSEALDRIDAIVPPGRVLNEADLGWDPPWMEAQSRRRPSLTKGGSASW